MNHAKSYKKFINPNFNYVLEATHPSPLSANKGGWFGCKHFIEANKILERNNNENINWISK